MDHKKVTSDMFQLILGQNKKGAGGTALKEKNIGH